MCILKQINVSGPEKGDVNGSIRVRGIYFPSGQGFLRSLVQSRLDMKEALVGSVVPRQAPENSPAAHFLIRSPTPPPPLAQGHAGCFLLLLAFSMLEKIIFQTCFSQSALRQPTNYWADPSEGCPSAGKEGSGLPFKKEYFKQWMVLTEVRLGIEIPNEELQQ